MTASAEAVNVRILDREYTIGAEPGERDSLLAAAKLLDARMREVRGDNRVAQLERVAVLTALNLAHELEQLRTQSDARDRSLVDAVRSMEAALPPP